MNRFLNGFNLLGVIALAALCAVQWRNNGRINLQLIDLEKTRIAQSTKIAEQEKAIKGYVADLDDFRERLTRSEAALDKMETKLNTTIKERNQLTAQRDQLVAERDELKTTLDKWVAAVAERDKVLKQAGDEVQTLLQQRNDAIARFNDLVGKYNALVKDLDAARAKLGSGH